MSLEIDPSNLRELILQYPLQLNVGQKMAKDIELPKKAYSHLVIVGMGGSALPGDLLSGYFTETKEFKLPIVFCRGYNLAPFVTKNSLVFVSSYSGTTEETVSAFEQALKVGATCVAFCQGGKIKELADAHQVPCLKYKINLKNFQARYTLTYTFFAMHQVLANAGLCESIKQFPTVNVRELEVQGEEIAKRIKEKTPVIYASDRFEGVVKIWKGKINENAKTPAFCNVFPELNHNEMVGFTRPQCNFYGVMLQDENDHPSVQKRMNLTAELYKKQGVDSEIVKLTGKNYLEKMINALVLGDWVSYYLALEYEQDPTPVEMVDELKSRLKG